MCSNSTNIESTPSVVLNPNAVEFVPSQKLTNIAIAPLEKNCPNNSFIFRNAALLYTDRRIVAVLVFTVIISVLVIFTILIDENPEFNDPHLCLKKLKFKNVNHIIYDHFMLKFEQLQSMKTW